MASDDFDHFLDDTVRRLGEDERVRQSAAADEEEQRTLFLRTFRDVAQNDILPVFKRVEERRSDVFGVSVLEGPEFVTLKITLPDQQGKQVSRSLRLKPDFRAKRVLILYDSEVPSSSARALSLTEGVSKQVEALVLGMIKGLSAP